MSSLLPMDAATSVTSLDQLWAQLAEAKLLGMATPSLRALWARNRARRGRVTTEETAALPSAGHDLDWLLPVGDDQAVER